ALASGFAIADLHHAVGHDRAGGILQSSAERGQVPAIHSPGWRVPVWVFSRQAAFAVLLRTWRVLTNKFSGPESPSRNGASATGFCCLRSRAAAP
ncbi:MAG: hypothetical protein EOQ79_17150, partial [Mesorhizobium sp.]